MTFGPLPVTVIVPVKATHRGKSRLRLPEGARRKVAQAMAIDTVTAVSRVARVLAVVEDPDDAAVLGRAPGVRIRLTSAIGLNEAILDGLATLPSAGPVASLPADLSGLYPADLRAALLAAQQHDLAAVADRQGVGTTLLVARRPELLIPRYGGASFARHLAAGAVALEVPADSSLRMDIDTPEDLQGRVGPRLALALRLTGILDDAEPAADLAS